MQENFRSNFTSKRKRPRFSAPLSGGRPMRIPADWAPLFPKSTYRTFLDIDPEKALLPLRGVPRPAGCPLSGSVLFVSDRIRYRLCSDRAAAREEPFQSLFPPMEISTSSFLRSHCRASSLPPAAVGTRLLPLPRGIFVFLTAIPASHGGQVRVLAPCFKVDRVATGTDST